MPLTLRGPVPEGEGVTTAVARPGAGPLLLLPLPLLFACWRR
jgi:hypothetical protein